MKRFFRRGDLILVISIIATALLAWIVISSVNRKGEAREVKISCIKGTFVVPISDTTLEVPGILGRTLVRIKDEKVWVEEASCPNKLCMRQGKISKPGETLVCLPNRIVITIEGTEKTDAVTY